jgi:NTE family protein
VCRRYAAPCTTARASISIGAINDALIVGNARETRVLKLRAFWHGITTAPWWSWSEENSLRLEGDAARQWLKQLNLGLALVAGALGFFTPRFTLPWLQPPGTADATSIYD